MVKLFACAALLILSFNAYSITPEELRSLSADKNREEIQRSNRVNTGSVDSLIPETTKKPVSSKYGSPSSAGQAGGNSAQSAKKPKQRAAANANKPQQETAKQADTGGSDFYVPPARPTSAAAAQVVSDAVPNTFEFGIRLGTWMPANLNRDTSSAEPGTVELTISEDVIGDRRTLPAGSIIFANKALNSATKRMELTVTKGITPKGQEFKLRGLIFDPQKVSGLSGIYTVDEKSIAKHGLQKGTVAAIGAAAQTIGGSPLAAAGTAATQTAITDTNAAVEYNAPTAVIYVSPQPLIIRVEERF